MMAIDTNVLVRFIMQDDEKQAVLATKLIESCDDKNPALINHVVLVELIWVLENTYEYSKRELVPLLKQILATENFEIPQTSCVWKAISDYEHNNVDFADCMISQINHQLGSKTTWTFDKKASKLNSFELLR